MDDAEFVNVTLRHMGAARPRCYHDDTMEGLERFYRYEEIRGPMTLPLFS